jgi:tetratricopeptide (TPR) repeat protein
MSVCVFENKHIKILYEPESTKSIVLSFNPMNFDSIGNAIPAGAALKKMGYSALGVVSKSNSWFPSDYVEDAIPHAMDIINKYDTAIGYGYSMGAYGAIRFSKQLRCRSVLAVSPQYSINPEVVAKFDWRYHGYYRPENIGMEIKQEHCSQNIYVVVDPRYPPDFEHFKLLNAENANCSLIAANYCGHDTIKMIADTSVLRSLLGATEACDVGDLARCFNSAKKKSSFYHSTLLYFYAQKRYAQGRVDSAILAAKDSLRVSAKFLSPHLLLRQMHNKTGEHDLAIRYALDACELSNRAHWVLYELAEAYRLAGRSEEANAINAEALAKSPNSALLLRQKASLEH